MKTTKLLSLLLSASLAGTLLPSAAHAEETGYTSVTINPADFANYGRTYYIGNNNSGMFGSGNAKVRSIIRDNFMNMEGIWKNNWNNIEWVSVSGQSGSKKDNTLMLNGIDYEVRVSKFWNNETDPGTDVLSVLRTFGISGSDTTPYYKNFDVKDGFYRGISFLGGGDMWGSMPYIRYHYTDDTMSNWVSLSAKKVNTAPAEGDVCLAVPGVGWDNAKQEKIYKDGNDDIKVYLYQINEMSVDSTKKLASYDILARNGAVEENSSAEPTANNSLYAYSALILGATLLTDAACENNAKIEDLKAVLSQLPPIDEFVATDENVALLKQLIKIFQSIDSELIDENDQAAQDAYYAAMDYVNYEEDIKDVYKAVPYTSFVNSFRAYYDPEGGSGNGNAYSGGGIVAEKFKTAQNAGYAWKNAWNDGDIQNTLVFNGWEYNVAVVPKTDYTTNVTFQAGNGTEADTAYHTIDIEDGYYNGISFLGGLEYNASAAAVRLNYADGTDSGFVTLKDSAGEDVKKIGTAGLDGECFAVTGFRYDKVENQNQYVENTLYLHQYNIAVDSTKLLTSIDLPSRNAVIENGKITGIGGSTYNVRWFGIGLKANGFLIKDAEPISVKISPDAFANNERTYDSNVYSGNQIGISKAAMLGLSNWTTKPDLTTEKYGDGVFNVNGTDYTLRIDKDFGPKTSYTGSYTQGVLYDTVDITDGYYTAISLIGGGRNYKDDGTNYIRFNYKGGKTSGWIKFEQKSVQDATGAAVAVDGYKPNAASPVGKVYIHQVTIPCDSNHIITSVDFLARKADVVNGEAVEVDTQVHGSTWLGMTMITNRKIQKQNLTDDSKEPITVFVSPDGEDTAEGTAQAPLKTVGAALEKAKDTDLNSTYARDVVITLAGGEYEVLETADISGLRGKVTLCAKEGKTPVIKGSKTVKIAEMADYNDGATLAKKINVESMGLAVPASILTSEESLNSTYTFGVFSGGTINPIAEYPNNDALVDAVPINTTAGETISITDQQFTWYPDGDFALEGYFVEPYRTYKTTKFTVENDTVTLTDLTASNISSLKRKWRMFDNLGLLDNAGEWYLDRTEKILYYIPREGETEIEISNMTDTLINIGMDNVTIVGITFKDTCGDAVTMNNVSGTVINNCAFEEIGRTAISGKDVTNVKISANIVSNIGYKGIVIGGGNINTLEESGNVIENNSVERPGSIVRCYANAIGISGVGNVVKNNYVAESKSILISFSGSLNKIINNKIVRAGREADDLGAVYGGRNLTYLGNEIAYNHIINADRDDGRLIAGIYLDDGLSGTNVHHNVIEKSGRGVFTNGGALNTVDNNVLIDCSEGGVVLGNNPISAFTIAGKTMTEYAKDFFAANPAYAEKFTSEYLANLTVDVSDFKPVGVTAINNRFSGCTEAVRNTAGATEEGTEIVSGFMEGIAKADIDTNRIGIEKNELDDTIAYVAINGTSAVANFVSAYSQKTVAAAAKDSEGRLLKVVTIQNGVAFDVPENTASISLYVWDGLDTMVPVTK